MSADTMTKQDIVSKLFNLSAMTAAILALHREQVGEDGKGDFPVWRAIEHLAENIYAMACTIDNSDIAADD